MKKKGKVFVSRKKNWKAGKKGKWIKGVESGETFSPFFKNRTFLGVSFFKTSSFFFFFFYYGIAFSLLLYIFPFAH